MRTRLGMLVAAVLMPVLAGQIVTAQNGAAGARQASNLLQEAIHLEEVVGDLQTAIKLYQRVADEYPAQRDLAARALVRMGQCYEKLGDEQARGVYQRVLRDYADQNAASAAAGARLAAIDAGSTQVAAPAAGLVASARDRLLPAIEPDGGGIAALMRLSPDGRRALFFSVGGRIGGQNLGVYTYENKVTTFLTNHRWSTPEEPMAITGVWSPDGRQVAYSTLRKTGQPARDVSEVYVATPGAPSRLLFSNEDGEVSVTDWLRQGRALVIVLQRRDRAASIGLVSLDDGSFRELRTLQWSQMSSPQASPDGRYILFEDGTRDARDLFLLARDGSSLTVLDEHPARDTEPLWSPDGRHVVFRSNRQGQEALWAVAVEDGKAAGQPFVVMEQANGVRLLNWTDGGLAHWRTSVVNDIYMATIDPTSGEMTLAPKMVPYSNTGSNQQPSWSPDGRSLAFLTGGSIGPVARRRLVILPLDGGRPRELQVPDEAFNGVTNIRWKPDGTELSLNSRDRQNRPLLLRLSLADLAWRVEPLPEDLWFSYFDWTPSWDEFFYYGLRPGVVDETAFEAAGLFKRNARTGEHVRVWETPVDPIRGIRTSPDGKRVAFAILGRIWIYDLDSGTARQIPDIAAVPNLSWSPDSRRLLFVGTDRPGTGNAEGSGNPGDLRLRMLDIVTGRSTVLTVGESLIAGPDSPRQGGGLMTPAWAPDGTRIAFGVGANELQMRILEHPLAGVAGGGR